MYRMGIDLPDVVGPDGQLIQCNGENWRWLRRRHRDPLSGKSVLLPASTSARSPARTGRFRPAAIHDEGVTQRRFQWSNSRRCRRAQARPERPPVVRMAAPCGRGGRRRCRGAFGGVVWGSSNEEPYQLGSGHQLVEAVETVLPPTSAQGAESELSHDLELQQVGPALKQQPVQGKPSAAAQ